MTIRLGYQIPNFTYPDTPNDQLFDVVIAQAREAEASGFDTVLVMDHFYQLPGIGTPDHAMLECYTTLGALATATSTVQLSALVTGVTYRNPPMLAKAVTTLDVVSKGRAVLGIGAGWFEREHHDYGYEFGTFTDRFERLEEALNIIAPMLRGEAPSYSGAWYTVRNALNNPRVRPTIPIMLGGSGEKKTFRLAALFADHLNVICGRADVPRKIEALRQRCAEADRDPETLATSFLTSVLIAESEAELATLLEPLSPGARSRIVAGTPDRVAEILQKEVLDQGITGLTINMPYTGHRPGAVELAGRTLRSLVE
ncbi:LLM class F420-dependent oxidoreductase [Cryptosporangium aurantiacum]|uniref:Probable F420-dependent oxidoreductase, Rv1855c family n=1 Tax=Cryptosporangium aurantiacum TaxID=134849 RepID=A0A1M7TWQ1_9ACTN|nr:LLM class F420-dependent oxidoreductase [Cryptosporangium aurantiacum]SHN75117.1 probable F420-dependent oxidoreductase, Rv1855c family [Cryptosporangium aurantiacum]